MTSEAVVQVFHGKSSVLDAVAIREMAATRNVREVAYDPWRLRSEASSAPSHPGPSPACPLV